MAGIIVDVSDDLRKLQSLKKEIEEVKRSLNGINVNVDIEIAKGIEDRLKSLTEQYDILAQKIAKTEAEIAVSVKRINDASEKIAKIQGDMASAQSALSSQEGNAHKGNNDTSNIQAQAKAYDELAENIQDVLDKRGLNIAKLVEEQRAIERIKQSITQVNKNIKGNGGIATETDLKLLEYYNQELITHKNKLSEIRQVLNNNAKLDNATNASMDQLAKSLERMRIAYRKMSEEEKSSPFGKTLLASIEQADAKIKELDASIGNHQRNVGNYASGWNGLSMSIQQIGRELPSLAYGPKVFFSAISNNLPILADEIKRARKEFELLKQSGQSFPILDG